jgi:glycosyltransferase involved in cell wall biosynthesis
VVTPSFNSAAFIAETLASVAALAVPHEHIVVDGGSADGTVDVLRACADPGLVWVSEPDRGQTHAVNKGLDRARGDLVGWLNADDAYVRETVEAAVAHLDSHPETAAVFGTLDVVDADGELLRRYRPGAFDWRRYLYLGDYVPTPTIIFRRRLLEGGLRLDERWADAADYDFYLRLLKGRTVHRIEAPLVRFRYYADSKTASNPQLQQREALAIRLAWAQAPRHAAAMRAIDRVKRAVYRVASPLPPRPGVARAADAVRRVVRRGGA